MSKKNKIADFEKNLNKLEDLVKQLENGELSLDESLKQFEEGISIARECQTSLSEAEQRIQILTENANGEDALEDFTPVDDK